MYVHRPLLEEHILDYNGVLRLIINRAPWRLIISLKGVSISSFGVMADLDRRDFGDEYSPEDLEKLIRADFEYFLQLERSVENAGSPLVKARLTTKEKTASGNRLTFEFVETTEELEIFFEELVKAQAN